MGTGEVKKDMDFLIEKLEMRSVWHFYIVSFLH
jgi:hypothetical protein